MKTVYALLSLTLSLLACSSNSVRVYDDYDLSNPEVIKLPKSLREISGLSYYKKDKLLGVQDEKGILFEIDLGKEGVTETFKFHHKGDFEGVEYVHPHAYAVDSDGDVFHVEQLDESGQKEYKRETHINKKLDIEGLMYHSKSQRLWLLSKAGYGDPNKRSVFEYNPKTKQLSDRLVFQLDLTELIDEDENPKKFKPTAIAQHPLTEEIYILESSKNRLIIYSENKEYLRTTRLGKKLMRQPEGLAFLPDGTMVIADEGQDHRGRLFIFRQKND